MTITEQGFGESNPLDIVEEIVSANGWSFDRATARQLFAEMNGKWGNYRLCFTWEQEMSVLHFSCAFDMKVPAQRRNDIYALLALSNERLWFGHFEVSSEDGVPAFRQSVLMRGAAAPGAKQFEYLVDIALSTSERFYPAFQYVVWGGKSAEDAIAAAVLETVGEA